MLLAHVLGSAPTFPFLKYDAYTDLNLLYLSTTIMGPRNASYKSKLEYVQITGTNPTPAVLYSNILAQIRSSVHHTRLPGVKCAFIVGHLAKNEAVQKCYITGKTYTAVLVGHVRTAWTQQTPL